MFSGDAIGNLKLDKMTNQPEIKLDLVIQQLFIVVSVENK